MKYVRSWSIRIFLTRHRSPDISNASPVPMVTEDPNDPGRTRPTSDEEIVDKVTKTHGVPDLNWSLEEDRKKDH